MQITRQFTKAAAFLAVLLVLGQTGNCQTKPSDKEQELLAVLKGDAPAAEKAMACKRLAVYGSSESVAELAKFLPDPQLASWARIALEAIPGKTADEALRKSTESLEGNLLIGAINSIGVRRDAAAVELLTTRLGEKDADVATAAAVALGRIGNDAAAKSLRKALPEVASEVRNGVAEGSILCAERFLSDEKSAEAVALYDDVRQAEVPRQRKLEATRGAILARKQDGLPLLVEQLQSADEGMFQIALSTAREISGGDVDKALVAELGRATPERAALVITVMADRPKTVDLSAVLKAAGPGPKPVRLAAIAALARVGNATCLSSLLEAALDADADVVQTATTSLADLPGDGVNQDVVARLPKAQGAMYKLLIEVIGLRRIDAVAALVKALDHSDKAIRAAALTSLGSTVTPKSLNVLIAQVVTPKRADDGPVALQALKTASIRMPDREACASELAAALGRSSAMTKDDLLEILSEVGGAKSLQTIGAAAKSNDPQLQDTGSRLLGKWSSVDAAPVLLDLAKTAPSDKYHVRAVKGYISLARRFATMSESDRLEICQNALEVARYPADKKLVLDVLKLYPTVESLKLAIKAIQIPELKDDATEAALAIAPKIKGNADQVKDVLSKAGLDKAK
ncbi:MAG TPA: HEAT repeat domain-containing protein [Planctomycetaceae bacterium]|nr:HEAT repeat domain-containing protein [Planctomycetaceae bacterium]